MPIYTGNGGRHGSGGGTDTAAQRSGAQWFGVPRRRTPSFGDRRRIASRSSGGPRAAITRWGIWLVEVCRLALGAAALALVGAAAPAAAADQFDQRRRRGSCRRSRGPVNKSQVIRSDRPYAKALNRQSRDRRHPAADQPVALHSRQEGRHHQPDPVRSRQHADRGSRCSGGSGRHVPQAAALRVDADR